jgi:hypothetical protein
MDGRSRMTRHFTTIGCVLLLAGAGAAWLPVAPQQSKTASEPAHAEANDVTSGEAKPDGPKVAPERMESEPRFLQRSPRAGSRLSLDEDGDALSGDRDVRRWNEPGIGRGARDFSPEQIERLMQVVRDLDADRAARLEELRKSDPQRFAFALSRSGRHLLGLSLLKDRDPGLYELKLAELRLGQQVNRIAQEIHAARETCSEGELDRLENMLRGRLREQSELNYRARGREIILLEDHLKSMREKLVNDITHRDELIEERLAELLRAPSEDDAEAETFAVDDAPQR